MSGAEQIYDLYLELFFLLVLCFTNRIILSPENKLKKKT